MWVGRGFAVEVSRRYSPNTLESYDLRKKYDPLVLQNNHGYNVGLNTQGHWNKHCFKPHFFRMDEPSRRKEILVEIGVPHQWHQTLIYNQKLWEERNLFIYSTSLSHIGDSNRRIRELIANLKCEIEGCNVYLEGVVRLEFPSSEIQEAIRTERLKKKNAKIAKNVFEQLLKYHENERERINIKVKMY